MNTPTAARAAEDLDTHVIRERLQRESRLISRLMQSDIGSLHSECETMGLPHEGRSEGELRAALFSRLRQPGS